MIFEKTSKSLREMSRKYCWSGEFAKCQNPSYILMLGRSDASKCYDDNLDDQCGVSAISASWRLFNTHRTLPASQLRIRNRQNHMKLTLKKLK